MNGANGANASESLCQPRVCPGWLARRDSLGVRQERVNAISTQTLDTSRLHLLAPAAENLAHLPPLPALE